MVTKEQVITKEISTSKVKDYVLLLKFRLATLVVLSAVAGYFFAEGAFNLQFVYLVVGGFLITGSSNGFNQILERELDKRMHRTANRPIPAGRMSVTEAFIISAVCGVLGLIMLFQLNHFAGILGLLALVMYVFLYTPLKRITPWAVFVGAFPGAIPPMLGVVAVTGEFNLLVGIMFLIQFVWQFPHFWAIAWVLDEDYARGGFSLLPSRGRKNKASAFQIVAYSFLMIPVGILPWFLDYTGDLSLIVGTIAGLWFFLIAYRLYLNLEDKAARALMFASFIYLPIIQFLYVFDKI
ncbi:MAG: protoheme IX farnesyltransferase [Bacteroidetes bacterium]|nr:protoheme IX farnesyltransferase [Bacteroidota bacterium]